MLLPICYLGRFPGFVKSPETPGLYGAPEESRTPNLQIRSLMLYPIELRAQCFKKPNGYEPHMQVKIKKGNRIYPIPFLQAQDKLICERHEASLK